MNWTINEVNSLKNLLCKIEVKGYPNVLYLAYAIQKCDEIIETLTKALKSQNGVREDVTANAENHTG